jgi:hypothetical protein
MNRLTERYLQTRALLDSYLAPPAQTRTPTVHNVPPLVWDNVLAFRPPELEAMDPDTIAHIDRVSLNHGKALALSRGLPALSDRGGLLMALHALEADTLAHRAKVIIALTHSASAQTGGR